MEFETIYVDHNIALHGKIDAIMGPYIPENVVLWILYK